MAISVFILLSLFHCQIVHILCICKKYCIFATESALKGIYPRIG